MVLLDDSLFCQTETHSFSLSVSAVGAARCLSEEAPLIKVFSTGGRVLQEHRDAPAGWRDGIAQQLEDTLADRHREGERNPQQDSATQHLCPPTD